MNSTATPAGSPPNPAAALAGQEPAAHLAEQRPMEMSAPIQQEPVTPSNNPAQPTAPAAPLPEPVVQTEPAPAPAPPVLTAPAPLSTPPPSLPPMPAPTSAPAPPPIQAPQPAPVMQTSPSPLPAETQSFTDPTPMPPIAPVVPDAPVVMAEPSPKRRAARGPMIYSNNTQAVWHAERSNRIAHVLLVVFFILLISALIIFWLAIGMPTRIEDMPFVEELLRMF